MSARPPRSASGPKSSFSAQGALDLLFHQTVERARAEGRVVAALGEPRTGGGFQTQRDIALGELLLQL